ncbi:dna lyase [Aspergillus sclerotialis]|uniref:DNA-(apurinic or apyrimidinic site) endonuclease 2 n=1 Tax=Aspergillus sclerotialis TaxID=2070753 RepID=A0A3A2ZZP8_9EURO|nr:dna lyase [Aspergillus sclerotialis]
MFDTLEADIVVFQETKIQRKDLRDDMVLVPGWDCYFSLPRIKRGYSGVAIYTRNSTCCPIRAEEGLTGVLSPPSSSISFRDLPGEQQIGGYPTSKQLSRLEIDAATLDSEGRCVILEFPAFVLIGIYCPANRDESRDCFRLNFIDALDMRIRNLVSIGKRVFLTGDLNISRGEIDAAHAAEAIRKGQSTVNDFVSSPARRVFNQLLTDGEVVGERDEGRERPALHDICRWFHPQRRGMYTCWEQRINARPGNYGSRIDYVLCSPDMWDWFTDSNIQEGLLGSDHCPVYAVFKDSVPLDGELVKIHDIVNPPSMFKDGKRQLEYSTKYLLPLSGRLMPEFDKRRSIKDMFSLKPASSLQKPSSSVTTANQTSIEEGEATVKPIECAVSRTPIIHSAPASQDPKIPKGITRKRAEKSQPPRPAVPVKRSKSGVQSSTPPAWGQQTLQGFFKPKSLASESLNISPAECPPAPLPTTKQLLQSPPKSCAPPASSLPGGYRSGSSVVSASAEEANASILPGPSDSQETDTVIDQVASKQDWSKLFSKKPPPKCESHQESCISLITKKPGVNRGRAFWICPRPLGPSGNKENGTQWRCATFIWASDWNAQS